MEVRMRNSDKINFIGFSTVGNGSNTTKVRYAVDKTRREKVLQKINESDIVWYTLPEPMVKKDALQYISEHNSSFTPVQKQAIARAMSRFVPSKSQN
jgi:hypothetical protein